MEKAALQKIMEAEKKADELIAEGVRNARGITEKSTETIRNLKIEFEELLDRETQKIIDEKIKTAEAKAAEIETAFVGECNEIKEKASVSIDKAVAYVVEKVGSGKWQ